MNAPSDRTPRDDDSAQAAAAEVRAAEARIDALFADIEHEARGQEAHERLGELSDLVAGEYADHGLVHRLAGVIGERVDVCAAGVWFDGIVDHVGRGWMMLRGRGPAAVRALISLHHVEQVRMRRIAHGPEAAISELSIRSPLRGFASDSWEVRLLSGQGAQVIDGRIDAVGEDYVQIRRGGSADLIPLSALIAVQDLVPG